MTAFDSDRISIRGIEVFAHHGVLQPERDYGQTFVIDLTAALDLSRAAATDDLNDTLDYGALANRVAAAVSAEPVNLLETLAERICTAALEFSEIIAVEVTVHKPAAPLDVIFDDVSVTLVRHRS